MPNLKQTVAVDHHAANENHSALRWQYGAPPPGNANFAWGQDFTHHLGPSGIAGFVLANGSMSSKLSGKGEIRKNIIEADLADCMVALPDQLLYPTPIPAWHSSLTRNKVSDKDHGFRARRGLAASLVREVPTKERRRALVGL